MSGEVVITVVGNLVDDPELRFTPGGAAVAKFRVASTPRTYNKQSQAWEDGESLFLSCSVWRQAAEHCAETLAKGMRVIVQGQLKQRSYEDKQQVKRTVYELDVLEIGPSLRSATAKVTKASGSGGGQQARQAPSREGMDDPWGSTPAGGQQGGAWGEDPPF
ncbi:single-stranded DNA-binding protein [Streptomyces sp. SID161]|uniref:single-stranded DNA-binding protein n=1 Tax=Streptomyces sp. SID161 TaxID=2690251 RepID=UPI001367B307|nr:single-stranded DNA-binding protein [Streptomyces sp. SID161]MYW46348.1 single-stranded DNA-binding protein [Streptomyces sp. SID161]